MELRVLRAVAASLVPVVGALVGVAGVIAASGGAPALGVLLAGGVGIVVLVALAWIRQLPVRPGDAAGYGRAVAVKLAVAEIPALTAFVLAVVIGPWWLAAVGAGFSLVALAFAWPSTADRERHELLYLV